MYALYCFQATFNRVEGKHGYLWKTSVAYNNPRANFPPLKTDETLAERYFVGGRKK